MSLEGHFVNGKRGLTSAGLKLTVAIKGRSNNTLETGVLVRSGNGHCLLDDIDRLSTHQDSLINVLQTRAITLPFPGIHTTIQLKTSILATANTTRSHYDPTKLWTENVRIPHAMLNQFHLVFVMLDRPNRNTDSLLPEHVKAVHSGCKKSSSIADKFLAKPKLNTTMYETICDGGEENKEHIEQMAQHIDLQTRLTTSNPPLPPPPQLEDDNDNEFGLLPPIIIKQFIGKIHWLFSRCQILMNSIYRKFSCGI